MEKITAKMDFAHSQGEAFTDADFYTLLGRYGGPREIINDALPNVGITNLRHTPYAAGTKHSNWLTFSPEYVIPEFPSPDKARSLVGLIAELLNSGKFPANPPLF